MANTKSILIIGGSGFIGTHVAQRLSQGNNKVFATYSTRPIRLPGVTFLPCNVENRNWVKRLVYTTQPDIVIYIAGRNDVDWSEKNARATEVVHSSGPANVANFTEMLQPRFIFISNPYVFDGSRGNYRENDTASPVSTLGRMKLGGENVVRSKSLNYIVVRSSPLLGRGNGLNLSFIDRLRMTLDRNKRMEASTVEFHSFAPVSGLCEMIQRLIDSGLRNRVLHYGGLTKVNYFDLSRSFAKRFGYDPSLIAEKSQAIAKTRAPEGKQMADFSLNSTLGVELLKIKPLLLEESFDLIEKELIPRF